MADGKLHDKLAEVVAEIGYVAKDGKNDFQNYRYTSAEALLAEVRKPLSARRVTLMPALREVTEREYQTSKGKASVITTAHVRFTFVDGETGEREECDWAGQGDDPADKGLGKAFTNAIKTFLREAFLIPTGDDPEADGATDSRAADRAPRQQPAKRQLPVTLLNELRKGYALTGWDVPTLHKQLAGFGVKNVEDLSIEQAQELLTVMSQAVDVEAPVPS